MTSVGACLYITKPIATMKARAPTPAGNGREGVAWKMFFRKEKYEVEEESIRAFNWMRKSLGGGWVPDSTVQ